MNPNATDTMVVIGNYGDIWYRAENGDWVRDNSGDIQSGKSLMALVETDIEPAEPVPLKRSSSSSDSLSRGAVAGISVAATIGLCTLIVVVVFAGFSIVRKKRRGFMKKGEDTYLSINEESASNPHESNI
jgi:hypothetical protein